MKMNTIELNIDKYESMLKEIGVLKTENEDLKKRLLTSHNSDYAKLPPIGAIVDELNGGENLGWSCEDVDPIINAIKKLSNFA